MTDLIARLEAATGPDRELSDAVLLACGWTVDHEDHEGVIWKAPDGSLIAGDHHPAASIDAALTLVPEGWSWKLLFEPAVSFFRVVIRHAQKLEDVAPAFVVHGATPAIALCIAALRARKG